MLKTIKQHALRWARRLGVFHLASVSRWRNQRLLILCYHSITLDEEHRWRRSLFFTAEEFRQRLELIREYRLNILPLGEAIDRLAAGTLPPRAAVLTFDDGSVDFGTIVVPMLKQFGFPATVYVSTYYSQKRLPIFHLMVSYLLWKGRQGTLPALPALGLRSSVDLSDRQRRTATEDAIVAYAEQAGWSAEDRDRRLPELAAAVGVDYEDLRRRRVLQLMTADEMAAVAAAGFDVQLHTHRHRLPRERELFNREIEENRALIQRVSGRPAVHFCYPRGVHYPESPQWLKEQGVTTATTCVPGLSSRAMAPLLLPRLVDTAGLSPIEFEGWLSGISDLLPRRGGHAEE